jgi:arylsulfatase A-like enzyme
MGQRTRAGGRTTTRRLATGVAGLVALPGVVATSGAPADATTSSVDAAAGRPDVVVILTDDQRLDDLGVMTTVQQEIAGKGTTFANAFVVNTVCCPTRATLLTGRHSHGSGVFTNGQDCHGSRPFDDRSTVATTLDAAGYRTGMVGKYRNSWIGEDPPPGWDDWHAFWGLGDNSGGAYFDYQLDHNGVRQSYGSAAADYSTDVLAPYAEDFIRSTPASEPLFLMFTPFGPHGGQKPAPRHRGVFDGMVIPHGPHFNEADVSDKPAYVRAMPALTADELRAVDVSRRRARETLLSVDEAVAGILDALADTNRLSNTLVVFTSDQGFSRGEHRIERKGAPYEDILRVPLVARFDAGGTGARVESRMVANTDLAPTLAALAGTSMPGVDGRSWLPLLQDQPVPWRHDVLTEYVQGGDPIPSYCAIRTATRKYVGYVTGEVELYDLERDPYELANAAGDPAYATDVANLAGRAAASCSLTAWAPPASLGAPTRFVPLAPYRLFDTRVPGPFGVEKPHAGGTLSVRATGTGTSAIPAGAVAVALNVTVTEAEGSGFLTAFPAGARVPLASLQNFTAGTTAPNFTVAPLGAQGKVSLYVHGAAVHLLADVTGYFVPATSATSGRFVGLPPARILDTRAGQGAPAAKPASGGTVALRVLGQGGVPAAGVAAVAMQVTAVDATSPGFVTAYPGGTARPLASNLNLERAGQVRANLVVVPVGSDGTVNLFTSAGAHLVADVAGYVTDGTAPASASGLFVPVNPVRLRDTRVTPPAEKIPAGGNMDATLAAGALPPSAGSVLVNITATNATGRGFVTVHPAGAPRPWVSNLNVEHAGQTIPSTALVKVGSGGAITVFSQGGADLIVDAVGYLTA